ncbi:MAG: hypothetical protein Q4C47_04020, partial [Planctomycetia bacterium]|nr:hypothetical protein [Planctomycetia bacterium]
ILEVESLIPDHPQLAQLCRHLRMALDESGDRAAETVGDDGTPESFSPGVAGGGASDGIHSVSSVSDGPDESDLRAMMDAMPPEAMSLFTREIQPMLVSTCTTSGCHLRSDDDGFVLIRSGIGNRMSPRATERNLYAVLQWIDRDTPLASPLLDAAVTAHGEQRTPGFTQRQADAFRKLVGWCYMTTVMEPIRREKSDRGRELASGTDASQVVPAGFTTAGNLLRGVTHDQTTEAIRKRPRRTPLGGIQPKFLDHRAAVTQTDPEWDRIVEQIESGEVESGGDNGSGSGRVVPVSAGLRASQSGSAVVNPESGESVHTNTDERSAPAVTSTDPFDPAAFNRARPVPGFGMSGKRVPERVPTSEEAGSEPEDLSDLPEDFQNLPLSGSVE